jgi:hypothetical protein
MAPDTKLDKIMKASSKIEMEQRAGLMAATVKNSVFRAGSPKSE